LISIDHETTARQGDRDDALLLTLFHLVHYFEMMIGNDLIPLLQLTYEISLQFNVR